LHLKTDIIIQSFLIVILKHTHTHTLTLT